MTTLSKEYRKQLEKVVLAAREEAESGAAAALESYGVGEARKPAHLDKTGETLRKKLRAHGRQVGDVRQPDESQEIKRLIHECAYEYWHRMLFARFLVENGLLIEPESGLDVDFSYCEEEGKRLGVDPWEMASRFAQRMLPAIFRPDDPVLQVRLPAESRNRLTGLLASLPREMFLADDSLGWVYQFWQTNKKQEVSGSGVKIGAEELSPATQLFTEDYMVDFLLHNTLGAWWVAKRKREGKSQPLTFTSLQLKEDGTPAAGAFEGWPQQVKELLLLDPCMGSGHFLVFAFVLLAQMRMEEEGLSAEDACVAVLRDNLFGLELDPRCTQIAAFNVALTAWKLGGYQKELQLNLACCGLGLNAKESDWLAIVENSEAGGQASNKLKTGMEQLYKLFQKAPILGSLIDPRALGGDLLVAEFHDLQPLLIKALHRETTDEAVHELAVTAQGIAKAAEILARKFTLVATNVPFKEAKQLVAPLQEHIERYFEEGQINLATAFLLRIRQFLTVGATAAVVTPHEWLFLKTYRPTRESMLRGSSWRFLADIGEHGFESPQAAGAFTALISFTNIVPDGDNEYAGWDVTKLKTPKEKAQGLLELPSVFVRQTDQLKNPDARIGLSASSDLPLLSKYAASYVGLQNGDTPRFVFFFWEVAALDSIWSPFQLPCDVPKPFTGREGILRWEGGSGTLANSELCYIKGREAWKKQGVAVRQTRTLPATRYSGDLYDQSSAAIIPHNPAHLPAIWAYCSSPQFHDDVRKIDKKKNVTNATLVKVPFDLAHWQKVAAEKYPQGLPNPISWDPTQWLFSGHPKGSDHPLQVAVARLVGYRWPRQTGSTFPDSPAITADGLEKHADNDGLACFSQLRNEAAAASRLRALLADAYGKEWNHEMERKLISTSGSKADSLEDWLLNDFFAQHCEIFHNRPFVWHIWDGLKDGFNVLVNYHKLAGPKGEGHRTLEGLTYAYLGDWVRRQQDAVHRAEAGADDRLVAALELEAELKKILKGEPPYDLFVRWKSLHLQPIGWEPDINAGVRLNIRPFLLATLSRARMGCGLLRTKPGSNVNWGKDRGRELAGSKEDYPWFWGCEGEAENFEAGGQFDGARWNDCHYTTAFKQAVRAQKSNG